MDPPEEVYGDEYQGDELELMLAGKKRLSMFYEMVRIFDDMPEVVIPKKTFAPYVAAGRLICRSHDFDTLEGPARYIFYALPGEEWRIDAAIFLKTEMPKRRHLYLHSDAYDAIMGRLLDYNGDDVIAFIENSRRWYEKWRQELSSPSDPGSSSEGSAG